MKNQEVETKEEEIFFKLLFFEVSSNKKKNRLCSSIATIKISVGDKEEITVAEGDGPINALDNALCKALKKFYATDLDSVYLINYNVYIMDGKKGTASIVRVSMEFSDEDEHWTKIGTSADIIEASWQALAKSFRYKLKKLAKSP